MSKSTKPDAVRTDRRRFIRNMALTGAAVGAGAGLQGAMAFTSDSDALPEKAPERLGYHETPHIRDYYSKAAF